MASGPRGGAFSREKPIDPWSRNISGDDGKSAYSTIGVGFKHVSATQHYFSTFSRELQLIALIAWVLQYFVDADRV